VLVTDAVGCTNTATGTLTVNTISVTLSDSENTTGFSYSWPSGGSTASSYSPTTSGSFIVTKQMT
jgi:hypothetical protein